METWTKELLLGGSSLTMVKTSAYFLFPLVPVTGHLFLLLHIHVKRLQVALADVFETTIDWCASFPGARDDSDDGTRNCVEPHYDGPKKVMPKEDVVQKLVQEALRR